MPVVGGALMPAESLPGAEGLAERGEALAHRGHHGRAGVDECSAGAVADGRGDRVGQRERLGRRVVVQVAAGRLGPQPLPHQRRFHADLRGHLGGRQRSGSGQRCPQPAAGAEGGEQHAQRRPQLGHDLAHLRLDRAHVLAGAAAGGVCCCIVLTSQLLLPTPGLVPGLSVGRELPPRGREIRTRVSPGPRGLPRQADTEPGDLPVPGRTAQLRGGQRRPDGTAPGTTAGGVLHPRHRGAGARTARSPGRRGPGPDHGEVRLQLPAGRDAGRPGGRRHRSRDALPRLRSADRAAGRQARRSAGRGGGRGTIRRALHAPASGPRARRHVVGRAHVPGSDRIRARRGGGILVILRAVSGG